jgi:hypothetical protein
MEIERDTKAEEHERAAANDGAEPAPRARVLYGLAPEGELTAQAPHAALVLLPNPRPANDETLEELLEQAEVLLAQDPEFDALCDERRAEWIAALEAERAGEGGEDENERDAAASQAQERDDERT